MILFKEDKLMFVFPKKTSSTSLIRALDDYIDNTTIHHEKHNKYYKHQPLYELTQLFNLDDFTIIATVRNPVDYCISFYSWYCKRRNNQISFNELYIKKPYLFRELKTCIAGIERYKHILLNYNYMNQSLASLEERYPKFHGLLENYNSLTYLTGIRKDDVAISDEVSKDIHRYYSDYYRYLKK